MPLPADAAPVWSSSGGPSRSVVRPPSPTAPRMRRPSAPNPAGFLPDGTARSGRAVHSAVAHARGTRYPGRAGFMTTERSRTMGSSVRVGRVPGLFFAALALLPLACGARSGGSPEGVGSGGAASKPRPTESPKTPSATGGSTGSTGGGAIDPNSSLGPCVPGFSPADEPRRPCNWFADGLCYDDKRAACSCICPRDRKSICASPSYKGDGERTQVTCF